MRNFLLCSLLAIFVFFSSANAKSKAYFDGDKISPNLLDSPFDENSEKYKEELQYIIDLQKNPDPKELEAADNERGLTTTKLIQYFLPELSKKDSPKLHHLLKKVHSTSKKTVSTAKEYWNMKRPFMVSDKITPLIKPHTNPAYPSGHTSAAYSLARVLILIFPDRKEEFLHKAEKFSWHRILVGVHFPKDIEGGKQMALLITGALMENKDFLEDLESAIKETKKK